MSGRYGLWLDVNGTNLLVCIVAIALQPGLGPRVDADRDIAGLRKRVILQTRVVDVEIGVRDDLVVVVVLPGCGCGGSVFDFGVVELLLKGLEIERRLFLGRLFLLLDVGEVEVLGDGWRGGGGCG